MPAPRHPAPCVYLLADHLDAVLAAGEDLTRVAYPLPQSSGALTTASVAEELASRHQFVDGVQVTEMLLVQRVLGARERCSELQRLDPRLRIVTQLFLAGTVVLADAVADLADRGAVEFRSAGCLLAYLRSRGVIGHEEASLAGTAAIAINDSFLVAGRIMLGPLMDLAATFLDALELHYELYAAIPAAEPAAPATGPTAKTGNSRSLMEALAAMRSPEAPTSPSH